MSHKTAISAILVLAIAVFFFNLSGPSVWTDEAATVFASSMSAGEIVSKIAAYDVNPPGSYLLFHFWGKASTSLPFLRSLSALFATATAILIYVFGAKLFSRRAGTLAAILYLISPLSIAFARQVRYPQMLTFFALASTMALLNLVENPQKKTSVAYAALALAGAYTHYYFGLVLVFHAVFLVVSIKSIRNKRPFIFAGALFFVGYLPWLPVLANQLIGRQSAGLVSEFPYAALPALVVVYLSQGWTLWQLPDFWTNLFGALNPPEWAPVLFAIPLTLAVIGGLIVGPKHKATRKILGLYIAVPLALFLIISLKTPLFAPHYFLPFLPAVCIAAAIALCTVTNWARPVGAFCVLIVFIVPTAESIEYFKKEGTTENWKGIARSIRAKAQSGDLILLPNLPAALCLKHYETGEANLVYATHATEPVQIVNETAAEYAKGEIEKDAKRIWYVQYYADRFDPQGRLLAMLQKTGLEVSIRYSNDSIPASVLFDERVSLRLFIVDPELLRDHLSDEFVASDFETLRNTELVKGIYEGSGPMRWAARDSKYVLWVDSGKDVCAQGIAPSQLYPTPQIEAQFELKRYARSTAQSSDILAKRSAMLAGEFFVCLSPGEYAGPIALSIECLQSFIPDEIFGDGDRSEKCLQLRRVWTEPATGAENE